MMTTASAPSTEPAAQVAGRQHLGRLLLAEWAKLRSVPRWITTMVAAVLLTILVAVLTAGTLNSGVEVDSGPAQGGPAGPDGDAAPGADVPAAGATARSVETEPPNPRAVYRDELHFFHRPLPGDGSIEARVASQQDSHEWAKAGILIKERAQWGASYAALMVTPDHGVHLRSNFTTDLAGSDAMAPRWLRLSRSGDRVTGYESDDGERWREVGTLDLDGLPETVEVGLFVASPNEVEIERVFGGESISEGTTFGEATFDNVTVQADGDAWLGSDPGWSDYDSAGMPGLEAQVDGDSVLTLQGTGEIGTNQLADDVVQLSLLGALVGMIPLIALGVLFITSEYKRGMIRTTFTASPRRGQVLAAKAAVLGAATFVAGLLASVVSFLAAQPLLRSNGYEPPEFPALSLLEGTVLRAVLGTAALMAITAVLSMAIGVLVRHSAAAITIVILAMVFPQVLVTGLPVSVANWLTRLTPSAGFAVQETIRRYDTAISPLAGFGVLCAYATCTLGLAVWAVRRRDA